MTEARIKEADKYKKGKYKNKKMEYIDILFFIQKALNFHQAHFFRISSLFPRPKQLISAPYPAPPHQQRFINKENT